MKIMGIVLAGAASLAMLMTAQPMRAADLPAKAIAKYTQYPTGCGFFYGGNATVDAGTASTVGAVASSALYGGSIGINGGYTCPIPSLGSFWFVEAMFDLSTVQAGNGSSPTSIALNRAADFEQRFAIGVPQSYVDKFASLFPGLSSVAMPSVPAIPGVQVGQNSPYAFVSTHEQDVSMQVGNATGKSWLISWGAGVGLLNRLSNGWMLDTWAEYRNESTGILIGPAPIANAKFGNSLKVGASIKF